MTYWLTQSLLSSWIYYLNTDEERSQAAWDSFVSTLRREEKEPTLRMLLVGDGPPLKTETWREIGRAMDRLEGKRNGETG